MTKIVSILFFITLLLLLFLSWFYVFNIYEVDYKIEPEAAHFNSGIIITLFPVNSFGTRAPFRKIQSDIEILAGKEFIASIEKIDNGKFKLVAGSAAGNIKLEITTDKSLSPVIIEIPVIK